VDLQIIQEKENILLSRKEINAKIMFDGKTPSRQDVQKELAKTTKAKEEMIIIRKIDTSFGTSTAIVTANIYTDAKMLKETERQNLVEKHIGHVPKKVDEEAE